MGYVEDNDLRAATILPAVPPNTREPILAVLHTYQPIHISFAINHQRDGEGFPLSCQCEFLSTQNNEADGHRKDEGRYSWSMRVGFPH